VTVTPTQTATGTPTPTPTQAPCAGDCDGNNRVTIDELLTMVNIALGNADVSTCRAGDPSADNQITVDEIILAVNHALNGCPERPTPTPSYVISGRIRSAETGAPVPGVVVALKGATTLSTQTDANGSFSFGAVSAGQWTIEPVKTGGADVGIDAQDAVQVLQFSAGLGTPNPAQQLACNVSGEGTITESDAVLILEYVMGQITAFPVAGACGSEWVFIPVPAVAANQSVTQPAFSGGTCQLGSISFDPLSSNAVNQDFEATAIGDCNLSWPNA
jgi:hypothetical protein